jgi:3',5'-cyclic AMP phosphodiesterase CpdA
MAWAGTGTLCVMQGGVLKSFALNRGSDPGAAAANGELSFVQISDSHMGFNKPANTDVVGTFQAAVDKINALPTPPEFLLHTGDISHLSKPEEFDHVDQIMQRNGKQSFLCRVSMTYWNDGRSSATVTERVRRARAGAFDQKACTLSAW